MINSNLIRKDFKIFEDNKNIYFDSSSTTQKPNIVIQGINEYYNSYCSNTGRGNYKWENISTKKIDDVRQKVARFINANNKSEIIFTSGATFSSNMIAYSYGFNNLRDGDEIILCNEDHKSTILPWINLSETLKKLNINIKIISSLIDKQGDYKEDDLIQKINQSTKIVVLTHIHNVYGIEMNIEYIIKGIREKNSDCIIVLDASQSAGHINIDVKKLGVNFLYFSGHKMFADTGIGVLYASNKMLDKMNPFIVGGGYDLKNNKFECGTQNISGIISLGLAIDYIQNVGIENIEEYLTYITGYLITRLNEIEEVEFEKGAAVCKCRIGFGIVSFYIYNISSQDINDILKDNNIYVRTENYCTSRDFKNSIRVSLHIYNTKEEIDKFISLLKYIIKIHKEG